MLLSLVDVIFADVAQPDQARIVIHNAQSFLKDGGHVVISIKASCVDSTIPPEVVYANEVEQLKRNQFKPLEQVTLEPYERGHAMVTGTLAPFDPAWPCSLIAVSLQRGTCDTRRSEGVDRFLFCNSVAGKDFDAVLMWVIIDVAKRSCGCGERQDSAQVSVAQREKTYTGPRRRLSAPPILHGKPSV